EDEREALDQVLPDKLRKSILQQAIEGKLVAQDPGDEDASILVERIRKEKHRLISEGKAKFPKGGESIIYIGSDGCHYEKRIDKKGKVLSDTCIQDEVPFEIPNTWTWARLGACLDVRDGTHDSPKFVDKGFPLVTSKNLRNGSIDFSTCKHISAKDHDTFSVRSGVDNGDILMAMIGSIGNPVLVNTNVIFSCKNVAIFKSILRDLEMSYVHFYLFYAQEAMKKTATGGVQSFVSLRYLRTFLIPIPPLAEQQRIVDRVKELLAIITSQ
ncbi:restriction endonuclease subunit S, partial [Varibaculum cambriense]|uniref:restriction endonuclease subunit S n=1 Tax=Varibaculum cambriense TaxID=184870 RepID=UPI002900F8A0